MKLVSPLFSQLMVFREDNVVSIVIENQKCFYGLIEDISLQMEGNRGQAVLSKDNVPIPFSKNAELIQCFVPFTANNKALLGKIAAEMERTGMDEAHYLKTQTILSEIERYVMELAFDLACEVTADKLSLASILKACSITIAETGSTNHERILDYMILVRELERDKLFVFVNMRSYFSDEGMEAFISSVLDHKLKVLLIESSERARLPHEQRLTIDADWCEI